MSTINTGGYNPPPPASGLTVINIHFVEETCAGTYLHYDIGIGPSAGYAFVQYQMTGKWPLIWRISHSPNATIVYNRALEAVKDRDPGIRTLEDVQNVPIWAELEYDTDGNIRVCRSYPWEQFPISPDSVQVGNSSWANGSPDAVRATLIAQNSGLPVLLADVHEKSSPMVEWCANEKIAILPMLFPFGDYRLPQHDAVVDRKANLLELCENFVCPEKRLAYEMDAALAAAHGRRLYYVTATEPGDQVNTVRDLQKWSKPIPGKAATSDGAKLFYQITRHHEVFPHVEFCFCDKKKLCNRIYDILQNG